MLEKLGKALQGNKTYIVAVLVGVYVTLKQLGIEIPPYAIEILAALGLGSLRSAINKIDNKSG